MRIVSLSPSLTEILFFLGLKKEIVGLTQEFTSLSSAQILGSAKSLDQNRIQELSPDLIFACKNDNLQKDLRGLEKKYRVLSFQVASIPSLIQTISEIGKATEKDSQAKELIRQIYQEWPTAPKNPARTLLLLWDTPFLTVNANTYASHLLEAAGGVNVFRSESIPEVAIEIEDMIDQKPEVILLPTAPFPFEEKNLQYFKNLPDFSSAKIQLIDGINFSRFGLQTLQALKELRSIFSSLRSHA